jgi:hypothetical protein
MRRIVPAIYLFALAVSACRDSPSGPAAITVQIEPREAEVVAGDSRSFVATVSGSDETSVSWLVSGGAFVGTGASEMSWTAPEETGTYTIMAMSVADSGATASATVLVTDPEGLAAPGLGEYRGTLGSLPAGMFVTGQNGARVPIGPDFDPFTGVHDISADTPASFEGFGAFTNGTGHYSFGIRERGETDLQDARLFLALPNDSERHIVAFQVQYDVEAWYLGERANRIRLKFSTDTVGFSDLPDLVSTPNPRAEALGTEVGRIVDGSAAENRVAVSRVLALADLPGAGGRTIASLPPGETGFLRWQYSNAEGDEGEVRSGLAIANIRVVPVYVDGEPPPPRVIAPLRFSHDAGFYTEPFALELLTALPDATVYFSLDGSTPDPGNIMDDPEWEELPVDERSRTFRYEEPLDLAPYFDRPTRISMIPTTGEEGSSNWIETHMWRAPEGPVAKAVVVRAIAVQDDRVRAEATNTYFVSPEGRGRYSLPVVSLASDAAGLFGSEEGIYVPGASGQNFRLRGPEWERKAHLELFDLAGARPLGQDVGVRIHGGASRGFGKKSLRIYSRSEYGTSRMNHRFFRTKEVADFNRIIFRTGGNDWAGSLLRDATMHTLVQHLPFATQHYEPVIVFINGEYWGIHNARDRLDQHYIETHYGVPRDQVTILTRNSRVQVGDPGDEAPYLGFLADVGAGRMRSWSDFDEFMDVTGYLDYLITQMYAVNTDWPHNNRSWWRFKGAPDGAEGPRDGRWRWLLFDVDRSFGQEGWGEEGNMLRHLLESDREPWARVEVRGMVRVPEIRNEFIQRIAVHLATTFSPDRVTQQISRLANGIEPEISENLARWNSPRTRSSWEAELRRMRRFAQRRPDLFRSHVTDHFDEVTGTAALQVAKLGGGREVSLHSIRLAPDQPGVSLPGGVWTGQMFMGPPVVLTGEGLDLSAAEVSGSVRDLEQSAEEIRLVLDGPARIELP